MGGHVTPAPFHCPLLVRLRGRQLETYHSPTGSSSLWPSRVAPRPRSPVPFRGPSRLVLRYHRGLLRDPSRPAGARRHCSCCRTPRYPGRPSLTLISAPPRYGLLGLPQRGQEDHAPLVPRSGFPRSWGGSGLLLPSLPFRYDITPVDKGTSGAFRTYSLDLVLPAMGDLPSGCRLQESRDTLVTTLPDPYSSDTCCLPSGHTVDD